MLNRKSSRGDNQNSETALTFPSDLLAMAQLSSICERRDREFPCITIPTVRRATHEFPELVIESLFVAGGHGRAVNGRAVSGPEGNEQKVICKRICK